MLQLPIADRTVDYVNKLVEDHVKRRPPRIRMASYVADRPSECLTVVHGPYTDSGALQSTLDALPHARVCLEVPQSVDTSAYCQSWQDWHGQLQALVIDYDEQYAEAARSHLHFKDWSKAEQTARYRAESFQFLVEDATFDAVLPVIYWNAAHAIGLRDGTPYLLLRLRGVIAIGEIDDPLEAELVEPRLTH